MIHSFDSDFSQRVIDHELSLIGTSKNVLIVKSHPTLLEKLYEKKCTIEILKTEMNDQSNESITNTLNNIENYDFSVLDGKKFQVIVLDDLLENLSAPKDFLKKIQQFLTDDGFFVSSCYNIYNSINRINFLDAASSLSDLFSEKKQLFFSSLDDILLTLSESNFSLSKLLRVEKEITLENQTDLKNFVLPEELLKSISNDPESKTFFYVFSFSPNSEVDYDTQKWVSKFSTNLVTEGLQEILEKLRQDFERHITYLKQSNREQFSLIQHLEQSLQDKDTYQEQAFKDKDIHYQEIIDKIIEDKDAFLEKAVKDKDAYFEQAQRDKDNYIEQIIKDKDEQLDAIKNTFAYKAMRKLDKISGKNKD